MSKKLPKTVYAYENVDSDGTKYLIAQTDIDDCAERGERRLVGIYKLEKTVTVTSETKVE